MSQTNNNNNYSLLHHSFVSPMRSGINLSSAAAVPINHGLLRRDMSSSPYGGNKQRNERIAGLNFAAGFNLGGAGVGSNSHQQIVDDDLNNRMLNFNLVNLEDQERKYHEVLVNEKHHYRKKEQASKEIISDISKRLKQSQKRIIEESKVAIELKKRYDMMKKKMEKASKDKQENQTQLKSLYQLFQQQRKALEISITKTKKLEDENIRLEQVNKQYEDQQKNWQKKIDQLESEKDQVHNKHRRERDQLESDLEEKRQMVKRYENEFKDVSNQKIIMKKQLDEYEHKIKQMIIEFEESSKKHIKELNEVHEQYRGFKITSKEFESRIGQYKSDQQKALENERQAKKEVHQLRLENDELKEKLKFIELRYYKLIKRMGASQEDLQAIDDQILMGHQQIEDEEAQFISQPGKVGKGQKQQQQHPFQKVVDVRQVKNDSIQIEDYDQQSQVEQHDIDASGIRTESRLDRRRQEVDSSQMPIVVNHNEIVDSYEYYGDNNYDDGDSDGARRSSIHGGAVGGINQHNQHIISGDHEIEQPFHSKGGNKKGNSTKKTNIEVLDDERPMEQYYELKNNQQIQSISRHKDSNIPDSQSGDLLNKLIDNINGNPQLQNDYIRQQFKLDQIQSEQDLHVYKNLLNSMAALFYTNHRMNDVTMMFYLWREALAQKMQQKLEDSAQQQVQNSQHSNKKTTKSNNGKSAESNPRKKLQPPAGIQIDTDLANQEVYDNFNHQFGQNNNNQAAQEDQDDDEDEMINQMLDKDQIKDLQVRQFIEDLKQVGPFSKQILNYTYPPLLYQRGDDEEEEEGENDEEEDDKQLPDLHDDDEDDENNDDEDDDGEEDIQKYIQGAGIKNEDLYNKLKNVVRDKEAQQYVEQVDEDGNVYLVEADDQYEDGEEDDDGDGQYMFQDGGDDDGDEDDDGIGHQIIDGDDLEDEEFLQMMEQEALQHKMKYGRQ